MNCQKICIDRIADTSLICGNSIIERVLKGYIMYKSDRPSEITSGHAFLDFYHQFIYSFS